MDQLIIAVIILAISAISTLIQKKRQRQEEGPLPPFPVPRQRRPQPPASEPAPSESKPIDWEEQLRRLLEGEPAAPEPKPSPPTPLVMETRPPPPPPLPTLVRREPEIVYTETEEEAARAMAPLTQSAEAYARASQLHDVTAARMHEADTQAGEHRATPVRTRPRQTISPAVVSALAQLRQPHTVQQAFITALILGPPRALAPGEN